MNTISLSNFGNSVLRPLSLSAIIAMIIASVGCSSKAGEAASGPPAAQVSVAKVLEKKVRPRTEFTGRVEAVETVQLRPRVNGYIERVAFREGQMVKKGDLLFVIDPRPYQAALAQSEAQLLRVRSEAALAKTQSTRAQALMDSMVISREEFETRRSASVERNAAVQAAESAVAMARLDLEYTQVRAPISGRAGRAFITAGNLAQANTSLLTTVVSLKPVHVYFDTTGSKDLHQSGLSRRVRVGLSDEAGFEHTGVVDFIDNHVDPKTGTLSARAVLANEDLRFTPGLHARVQVESGQALQALLIDDKAVLTDQNRKYVYVVGKGSTAERKDVTLGPLVNGLRVVRTGLSANDRVVVTGIQKIFFPGMPLQTTDVSMTAASTAAVAVARK